MQARVEKISFGAIVPCYNGEKYLKNSLQSLVSQSEPFDEIIVVDDGSVDSSVVIIESFRSQYPNIRLLKLEKNCGVSYALNTGIKDAKSDYLILCAVDDIYAKDIIKNSRIVIEQHPDVGLVCGAALVKRYDLNEKFYRTLPYPSNKFISSLEFQNYARKNFVTFNGAGGMFINRQEIIRCGFLKSELKWHADWLLYFTVAFRRGIIYLDQIFIEIDIHRQGYAQGLFNKREQNEVMKSTVEAMRLYCPDVWLVFKEAAILPHYSLRYIFLILFTPEMFPMLSMKVLYKILINNHLVFKLGRLLPYKYVSQIRKYLKA